MSATCATVGCRREATITISWSMRDNRSERTTERVCAECAESYLNRPALMARIEPKGDRP